MSITEVLPVCAYKQASVPHEHGTRGMYGYHKCRCSPCCDANREYNSQASRYRARREMVDAELVRARIRKLRTAGLTVAEIADLCAANAKVIDYAVNGRKGKLPQTVQASTFRAPVRHPVQRHRHGRKAAGAQSRR